MGREKSEDDTYSPAETARRRDEALRRALSTPPKPHKPAAKASRKRRTAKTARAILAAIVLPFAATFFAAPEVRAQSQPPPTVDPNDFMDMLLRDAAAKTAAQHREAQRQERLRQIEQAEQARWHTEDLASYGVEPGTSPSVAAQQGEQYRRRRAGEVWAALLRYCPNGAPPCSPQPPHYVVQQAIAFGFIEAPRQPTTQCFGMADPEGPVALECYGR